MCLATSNNLLLVLQDAPKHIFSPTNSRSSGQSKNDAKTLFHHPPSPIPGNFCNCNNVRGGKNVWPTFVLLRNSRFNFHCYTQREATPTQKSARKWRCDLSRLLARKITKGIHSCKAASLNRPIGRVRFAFRVCFSSFFSLHPPPPPPPMVDLLCTSWRLHYQNGSRMELGGVGGWGGGTFRWTGELARSLQAFLQ